MMKEQSLDNFVESLLEMKCLEKSLRKKSLMGN